MTIMVVGTEFGTSDQAITTTDGDDGNTTATVAGNELTKEIGTKTGD